MAEVVIYTWRWGYQKGLGCSLSFSLRETSYHYCELFWNQCGKKLVSQASVQENQCLIVTMGASLCWHLQFYLWSILSPDNQKFKKKNEAAGNNSFYFEDTTKPTVIYTPYCSSHIFLRSFKCNPSLLHFQNIAWLLEKHPTSSAALHLVPYMVSA